MRPPSRRSWTLPRAPTPVSRAGTRTTWPTSGEIPSATPQRTGGWPSLRTRRSLPWAGCGRRRRPMSPPTTTCTPTIAVAGSGTRCSMLSKLERTSCRRRRRTAPRVASSFGARTWMRTVAPRWTGAGSRLSVSTSRWPSIWPIGRRAWRGRRGPPGSPLAGSGRGRTNRRCIGRTKRPLRNTTCSRRGRSRSGGSSTSTRRAVTRPCGGWLGTATSSRGSSSPSRGTAGP